MVVAAHGIRQMANLVSPLRLIASGHANWEKSNGGFAGPKFRADHCFAATNIGSMSTGTSFRFSKTRFTSGRITTSRVNSALARA